MPDGFRPADRVDQVGPELKREALVAGGVVVRTHVFVASVPDQNRSGDELERLAAQSVPETALPHVRDGERLVPLDEGAIVRAGRAPVVEH